MNLRDAVLCIDCDKVFTIEGSPCNPRFPRCASSVLMPLSAFVRTWTAFERGTDETGEGVPVRRRRMGIVHPRPWLPDFLGRMHVSVAEGSHQGDRAQPEDVSAQRRFSDPKHLNPDNRDETRDLQGQGPEKLARQDANLPHVSGASRGVSSQRIVSPAQ
jgi:hypothetical protein